MKTRLGRLLVLILLALMFKTGVALAYYDPELGRFIQPDTDIPDLSNPQSYNRYSYVMNNPLRYTDPSGHQGIPTPANIALGMTAPPGMEMQWNQRFQAANAQAAALEVGALTGMAAAGAAAPVLVGAGASGGFAAVGSGIVGGVAGDAAAQGTQMGLGTRRSFSGQEMAVSGLAGGAINGAVAGVGKVISSAGTPQVASSPASQAAAAVEQAATIKNPITANPGALQTVNPNDLIAGQRATLVSGRLTTQAQLQQSGVARNGGPPTVYENGVIDGGHHAIRAAADSGQVITVKVIPGQGASVTGKPVTQLPVHEN